MQKITLPEKPTIIKQEENFAVFEIKSCYPGYGATIGNALRRVLLSSLVGSAITSVKIAGVNHEFSTISGVMEDVVEIILNLKKIKFKMHSEDPMKLSIKVNKEGEVKSGDIELNSDVEVADKNIHIATITEKGKVLDMEITVENGIGYKSVEQQVNNKLEIGNIAVDTIFTPVKKVNYRVENMRVGKLTNFDKLIFEIQTDGSITPEEAFREATKLLMEHFNLFRETISFDKKDDEDEITEEEILIEKVEKKKKKIEEEKQQKEDQQKEEEQDVLKTSIDDINLSPRIAKILSENKIKTISKIIKKSEEDLQELAGMGSKGIKEIKKSLGKFGLTLKK